MEDMHDLLSVVMANQRSFTIVSDSIVRKDTAKAPADRPKRLSRRTRCAADLALRLLSPADRQRYREEWAAELADLPRRDQAPYAFRLLSRAWWLRRELSGKPSRAPHVALAVVVMAPGADVVAALVGLDWPAVVLGGGWMLGMAWVVSSKDRTHNLVSLIKSARSSKA
jgi:hypothetical protein